LKASLGRKFWKPHLNQWLGAMVHTYHPSYSGKYKQELYAQASLSIKQDPISKVTNTAVLYLFLLFCFFFFFHVELGFEVRVYTLSHSTSPFFVMDSLKIGFLELLAQSGFKPQSSLSLPPE
jgi:hypothetical protein